MGGKDKKTEQIKLPATKFLVAGVAELFESRLRAALQSGCVNSFRLNGGRNPHKGRCTNIVGNPSPL